MLVGQQQRLQEDIREIVAQHGRTRSALIPVLQDPPVTDSKDPAFNAYELANLLYNVPWNYPLVKPEAPSSDITLAVSRGSLAVDLGDMKKLFPEDHSKIGAVANLFAIHRRDDVARLETGLRAR